MSFRYQMFVGKEVLVKIFLLEKEILWLYILCFMILSVARMYCLTELLRGAYDKFPDFFRMGKGNSKQISPKYFRRVLNFAQK